MQKIAEKTFTTELILEGSWGQRDLGKHTSTMTLYAGRGNYFIEWDAPSLDSVTEIGLTFEHRRLVDYDGIFSLPREAIALIRSAGFIVPKDME